MESVSGKGIMQGTIISQVSESSIPQSELPGVEITIRVHLDTLCLQLLPVFQLAVTWKEKAFQIHQCLKEM